jgi:chromosome segregation ATPase
MKSYKVVIAVISLCLAAGLLGGYLIWGTKDEGKVDIRQLLNTLEEEVARIEKKEKDLVASIEAARTEIQAAETVRKENRELKGQLEGALQEKAGLERSLAELRTGKTDAEKRAADLQGLQAMLDDLKGRNAALETENRELKSAIDNISEITQRKQEAR